MKGAQIILSIWCYAVLYIHCNSIILAQRLGHRNNQRNATFRANDVIIYLAGRIVRSKSHEYNNNFDRHYFVLNDGTKILTTALYNLFIVMPFKPHPGFTYAKHSDLSASLREVELSAPIDFGPKSRIPAGADQ